MKEKILLDTNMMICILDNPVLDAKISKLTKILYDSDKYTIVIHPQALEEARKIKDQNEKDILISKLKVYKITDNLLEITEEFNKLAGCKNEKDNAVEKNCVRYFISNDKEIWKKAEKLHLKDRVLTIDEALIKFKKEEKAVAQTQVFIKKEYLYKLDLNDEFFESLKKDYFGFDEWFIKKQREGKMAYITKTKDDKITSFLMLKEEDENENYSAFEKPFKPAKRIKVCTFKVADTGKKIGECFIKIMVNEAIQKNVDEIYVTTFEKQDALIYLLKQYGFEFYTYKNTHKSDGTVEKEAIYVKNMRDKSQYPYVQLINQGIYIFPIIPKYHKLLFEDAEGESQRSIKYTQGKNTSVNAIKKAFVSNSKINNIKSGDIILFYESHNKKAITNLGIVETTWNKFESQDEIINLVRRRTAYDEEDLRRIAQLDSLVIMFKHYITFKNPISYEFLYNNGIVNGYIQGPISISKESMKKIIEEGRSEQMFEIM